MVCRCCFFFKICHSFGLIVRLQSNSSWTSRCDYSWDGQFMNWWKHKRVSTLKAFKSQIRRVQFQMQIYMIRGQIPSSRGQEEPLIYMEAWVAKQKRVPLSCCLYPVPLKRKARHYILLFFWHLVGKGLWIDYLLCCKMLKTQEL